MEDYALEGAYFEGVCEVLFPVAWVVLVYDCFCVFCFVVFTGEACAAEGYEGGAFAYCVVMMRQMGFGLA